MQQEINQSVKEMNYAKLEIQIAAMQEQINRMKHEEAKKAYIPNLSWTNDITEDTFEMLHHCFQSLVCLVESHIMHQHLDSGSEDYVRIIKNMYWAALRTMVPLTAEELAKKDNEHLAAVSAKIKNESK